MLRTWSRTAGLLAAMLTMGTAAHAQVVQSVHFGFGGFYPRGLDARANDDVIKRNIRGEFLPDQFQPTYPILTLTDALAFRTTDFRGVQGFGEWVIAFSPNVEVSAGVGLYRRSVPTLYRDLVDDQTSLDIEQTLSLRVVPLTGLVRFLPFGNASTVQPYVGVGLSALLFRYSEVGDFVDTRTLDIFSNLSDPFVVTGTAVGPLFVYGLRVPLGGDIYALTIEGRYQYGRGDTGGAVKGFVADKVDLSGGNFNIVLLIRF